MTNISTRIIATHIEKAIAKIAYQMEDSCALALEKAYECETSDTAKFALKVMLDNKNIAVKTHNPICQDTGMVVVFLQIGQGVTLVGNLVEDEINSAVTNAYSHLRKSVLDPISRINTKTNSPAVIYTSIVAGDSVKIEIMLKGFGSENMSKSYMLNPSEGLERAKELIVETVRSGGSNPCPPVVVGVGLGGTFDKCAVMSKHALFRKIGSQNQDPTLNLLEQELLDKINKLDIGAQGFGGKTTALGVFVESYPTHISSLPVAVNILCHCSRAETIIIKGE